MNANTTTKLTINTVDSPSDANQERISPGIKDETGKTDGAAGAELDSKSVVSPSCSVKEHLYQDCRVYVSNIPFSFRSRDLIEMFSPFGKVSNAEVVMNERGSKGFGFVTLDSKEASEAARAALSGTVVKGRVIEVKRATAMPSRRSCTSTRTPHPSLLGSKVIAQKANMDFFSPRQLPQVHPQSFVHANAVEQLNALLMAQNQMNLQSIINPTSHSDIPYSALLVPRHFPPNLQHAVVANGISLSTIGIPSVPLQFLYTTPSTLASSASNQPLSATLMPFSTAGLAYTSIPNVNQTGVLIQSPVPYKLAQDVSYNTKVALDTNLPMSQTSNLTYTGYLDLLGTLGLGNGIDPSSENRTSYVVQSTPHTLRSLDQSCVIDTSLHGEPLKEGQFGPIGSAVPPGNVSQNSSNSDFPAQSSVLDVHTFGYPSGNESLYTIPVYHQFEQSTDRTGRKRLSSTDGYHSSKKLAKSG